MYRKIASARSTGLPRTRSMTGRTLVGEMRTNLVIAFACMLLHLTALVSFLAAMAAKKTGRRELTQFMPDHILGDIHRHVSPPIVDRNSVADHLREDRRGARPGAQHPL